MSPPFVSDRGAHFGRTPILDNYILQKFIWQENREIFILLNLLPAPMQALRRALTDARACAGRGITSTGVPPLPRRRCRFRAMAVASRSAQHGFEMTKRRCEPPFRRFCRVCVSVVEAVGEPIVIVVVAVATHRAVRRPQRHSRNVRPAHRCGRRRACRPACRSPR